MKRLIPSWTLIVVLAWAAMAGAATVAFEADGIPVVLKTNAGTPVVSVNLALKGGVPHYKAEKAGIEVLLLRAARKGSENYPKERLQEILARTGTQIGQDENHDYTVLTMTCLRRDLDEAWKVFADIVARPTLAEDEVNLEKERQLNDVRQAHDNPDAHLRNLADALHYEGSPYAVPPVGTEASVERLGVEDLRAYHASEFNKSRFLITIVGDVDQATAAAMVKDGLGHIPKGSYTEPVLTRPGNVTEPETRLEARELPTNYIRGYYHAPSLYEDDYVPTNVALRILRDRLFKEVRTKRNLTYAVSAGMASRRDNYGMLYVTATAPDTTLRVMLNEVHAMQNEGISDKELADQLKVMITGDLMDQQTNASQAAELCRYELVGGGWQNAERVVERTRRVTRDDVRKMCTKYIKNIDFVMLGDPEKWKDPLTADRSARNKVDLK